MVNETVFLKPLIQIQIQITPVEKDGSSVGLEIHKFNIIYILTKIPSLRVKISPLLIVLHVSPLLIVLHVFTTPNCSTL